MKDFSVTNYNSYDMYWNYGYYYPHYLPFRGGTISTDTIQNQTNNVPQTIPQPDSVSFSANEQVQKQGLSTGAKIAVGAGIVTALAIGTDFIFCKGKHVKSIFGKNNKGNKPNNTTPPTNNDKPSGANKTKPKTPKPETAKAEEVKPEVVKPENAKPEGILVDKKFAEDILKFIDEIPKQVAELTAFAESIPNLSRSELAKIRHELNCFGSELDMLELASKKRLLSAEEELRLNYLNDKLKLVTEREKEIETALKDYNPADTVSRNSAISEHHEANGFNHLVRKAVKARTDNLKGLTENEIETEKLMMNIDKEFEQLPPISHDCIVYKGIAENPVLKMNNIPFKIIDNAKVGDIVVPDTAYTYTAFKRSLAEHWGGEGGRMDDKRIMMFEIYLPKGAKVSRNMEHGGEALMPRGAQYKLIDKKVAENGDLEVTLEYILPKAS